MVSAATGGTITGKSARKGGKGLGFFEAGPSATKTSLLGKKKGWGWWEENQGAGKKRTGGGPKGGNTHRNIGRA